MSSLSIPNRGVVTIYIMAILFTIRVISDTNCKNPRVKCLMVKAKYNAESSLNLFGEKNTR